MSNEENNEETDYSKTVYSRNSMEFATVAREYCVFAESAEKYSKEDFLRVASRILALLYVKASVLPETKEVLDEPLSEYVDYATYEEIRTSISNKLGSHDSYITTFKEDFKYSETPIAASISEDMADVYQDIRNFCEGFSSGDDDYMNDALANVETKFAEYWGQRLCNALSAIHSTLTSCDDLKDETPVNEANFPGMPMNELDDDDEEEEEEKKPVYDTASMPYFLRQNGIRFTGGKKSE